MLGKIYKILDFIGLSNYKKPEKESLKVVTSKLTKYLEFDVSGLMRTIQQINDLANGEEFDEYGVLRPTKYACQTTKNILWDTIDNALQLKTSGFPRGAVTTDENGGLRIEWSDEDAAVCLIVPAQKNGQSYIYYEYNNDYGTTDCVNGNLLSNRLQKFLLE